MNISQIKGMKYPDEYFIKYFFKNDFPNKKNLKFIEFGCSNGNNLMLPFLYNFNVIGIDLSEEAIKDANTNFKNTKNDNPNFKFYIEDMRTFAKNNYNLEMDVLLLPNVVNYIKQEELIEFLKTMIQNNNIAKDAFFFIRCRTPKDFRFGIGKKIAHNTYKLPDDFNITNEQSCLNRFYTEIELVSMLSEYLNLREYQILSCDCQNPQNDTIVFNSDIILWGKIN